MLIGAGATDERLLALRHQLDSHFLFNSLNSVTALLASGEIAPAERMVENLADFLRATLEPEALSDIRLDREFELLRLYLAIERERFPSRLLTVFELPPNLEDVQVPALIMQPLVENAVRHAVARSSAPVTVRIRARRSGAVVRLLVEDDGPLSRIAANAPSGIGIANVRARLGARYGGAARIVAGPRVGSGYAASVELPLDVR